MKKGEPFQFRQAQVYDLLRKGRMTSLELSEALGMRYWAVMSVLTRGKRNGYWELIGRGPGCYWQAVPKCRPKIRHHPHSLQNLAWGSPWAALEKIHGRKVSPRAKPAIELERTWGWGA